MIFHHMMITVSDMDKALALWRDTMGFALIADFVIPDGPDGDPNTIVGPELAKELVGGIDGASARVVLLQSADGALLEIQTPINPPLSITPYEKLQYGNTGVRELGLLVGDIDYWFERVQAAGYETTTSRVATFASLGRTFLFHDFDGNLIQLWERRDKLMPTWIP